MDLGQSATNSFTQPLAILVTLPLAFFGGFWALWLLGFSLDSVCFMGVIVLIGIVVNNGIVMVDAANQLRQQGVARREAIIKAAIIRMRPVLMTSITTMLAMPKFTRRVRRSASSPCARARG